MSLWDIVAYTYKADIYHSNCILPAIFPLSSLNPTETEDDLNILADAVNINRQDENTFDSDHFPKIVFRDQITDECCGLCYSKIIS